MKIIISIILVCLFQIHDVKAAIRFREISLQQAMIESSKEGNKPIFMMCMTTWCPYCNNMMQSTLTDSSVTDFFNNNFVCIVKDMESSEGVKLSEKFMVTEYPSFIFVDNSERILYRLSGLYDAEAFIEEGKNALSTFKQFPYLKDQFESDPTDTIKFNSYVSVLAIGDPDLNSAIAAHLNSDIMREAINSYNWRIIEEYVSDMQSPEFEFLVGHKKEYSCISTPLQVNNKLYEVTKKNLSTYLYAGDSINYNKCRRIAESIKYYNIDSLLFVMDLLMYETSDRWDMFVLAANTSVEKYFWNNSDLLIYTANKYLHENVDTTSFRMAISWIERALELDRRYHSALLKAKLLEKKGDYQNAIVSAEDAKQIGIESNYNYSEAQRLIWRLKNN